MLGSWQTSRDGRTEYLKANELVAFMRMNNQDGYELSFKLDHTFYDFDEAQAFAEDVLTTLSEAGLSFGER